MHKSRDDLAPGSAAAPDEDPRAEATGSVRLASIVAVDIAGYSSLTEQNRTAAAQGVLQIRRFVEEVTARHSGRVFNTAGDGLMLEFSAAERALAAIIDMIDHPLEGAPPIRVGAHLGDVFV